MQQKNPKRLSENPNEVTESNMVKERRDFDRLARAFACGKLLPPVDDVPNFVDLTRALAACLGVDRFPRNPHRQRVANFIGAADHLVFVLVDGMGVELMERLPSGSFLRSQQSMELRAICPSTTACALTTLATGHWPARHGVPGWWSYLEEKSLSVVTLPFQERHTETPLSALGVEVGEIWPFPSWMKELQRDCLSILPSGLPGSAFSRYSRGYTDGVGYKTIAEATSLIAQRVAQARRPTYTYLYLPEFDAACHHHGVDSLEATRTLANIEDEIERLAITPRGRARLIVSADHGHIDVIEKDRFKLRDGDPMLALLKAVPSAEPRMPVFHVREGMADDFERMFRERFGEQFALLTAIEAEKMRLFGPDPLSSLARRRFGDFIAVALERATLKYEPPNPKKPDHIGYHAGLTPEEMRIPLIAC